jgi:hypothetical protein
MQWCACGWQELCQKGYSAALMGENFVEASVEVRFAHRPQRHARTQEGTHACTHAGTDGRAGRGRVTLFAAHRRIAMAHARAQVHPSHIPLLIGTKGAVIIALRDALNVQVSA